MDSMTKKEVLECVAQYDDDAVFCPNCFAELWDKEEVSEGEDSQYCPNEMCLNGM